MFKMWPSIFLIATILMVQASTKIHETDGEESRKILGSSVVTSVSIVMDTGNGSKAVYTDAVGKPQSKPSNPSEVASPINLLNPDRYEFYTFDDNGDLVKRLMSLEEIQSIIATGDSDGFNLDSFTSQGFMPEKRVNDIVNNVQNVLKEEIELHREPPDIKPLFDTPDVSDSWSMILPAVFGNSGEDIKPEKTNTHVTADTMLIDPMFSTSQPQKLQEILTSNSTMKQQLSSSTTTTPRYTRSTTIKPVQSPTTELISKWTQMSEKLTPMLNVEIYSNSKSTTENPVKEHEHIIEIKPSSTSPEKKKPTELISTTLVTKASTATTPTIAFFEEVITPITFKPLGLSSNTTTDQLLLHTNITPVTEEPTIVPIKLQATVSSSSLESTTTANPNLSTALPTNRFQLTSTSSEITSTTIHQLDNIKSQSTLLTNSINSLFSTTESLKKEASKPTKGSTKPLVYVPSSTKYAVNTVEPTILTQFTASPWESKLTSNSTMSYSPPPTATIATSTSQSGTSTTVKNKNDIQTSKPSAHQPVEFVKLTSLSKETTTTEISLMDKLSTFMSISDKTDKLETTLDTNYVTVGNEKISTNEKIEDLNRVKTEYVGYSNEVPATSITVMETTTRLTLDQAFDGKQKVSASELLDQLLNTTNIYEINTELFDKTSMNQNNLHNQDTTATEESVTQTTTTKEIVDATTITETPITELPVSFEKTTEDISENTEASTTNSNLLESIEQILSQATGNIEESLNVTNTLKIQQMLSNNYNKSMGNVIIESATIASGLVDPSTEILENEITATEKTIIDFTAPDNILNDSVGSLLSQVYGSDMTTIDQIITTEKNPTAKTTPITNRKSDEELLNITTTESSENIALNEEPYDAVDFEETTTVLSDDNITAFENSIHLINITIVSAENRTKPAKADLSLEHMYFATLTTLDIPQDTTTVSVPETTNFSNTETNTDISTMDSTTPELYSTTDFIATGVFNETQTTTKQKTKEVTSRPETTSQNVLYSTVTTATRIKPSIVITISENSTKVTESGHLISEQPSEKQSENVSVMNTVLLRKPENNSDDKWTLVSTVAPHKADAISYIPPPTIPFPTEIVEPPAHIDLVPKPMQGFGLEDSTSQLDVDIYQFVQLCNELAFGFWKSVTGGLSSARSIVVSPFAATSLLAMVFLGARGATSGEMNEILKLDDMVTFNPHLIFKNVSESITAEPDSGIAVTTIIRELFSDRSKGKLLDFYKNRARAFYDGYVEEVSYREIGDVIRRRTNLLVKKHTGGKISEYLKDSSLVGRPPLTGINVNIFQTDCSQASTAGRDGELHFVVLPSIRQRRLVPIPAVVLKSGFLAGYEPSLDATAVALGTKDQIVSTILVIPGQQGIASPGDGLARLEKRLVESSFKKGAWSRLLRSLIPRTGMEVQIPRFSHRSIINSTNALKKMGLRELFDPVKADLRGLNGIANELHLSDVLQINNFATCGEGRIAESHHSEIYPATAIKARSARRLNENAYFTEVMEEPRDYQRAFHDPLHDPTYLFLPLPLRPRQARVPEVPRLKFDRPFMYFVRHNPTGLILHMGRFNPRLLP